MIYPEYFDKNVSRRQGRKVSLDLASEDPTVKKLVYACKKLELDYEIQEDKAFPASWWETKGRVLISIDKKNKVPKQELVHEIAKIVKRLVPKKTTVKKGRTRSSRN